jgi:hypothetical protein
MSATEAADKLARTACDLSEVIRLHISTGVSHEPANMKKYLAEVRKARIQLNKIDQFFQLQLKEHQHG